MAASGAGFVNGGVNDATSRIQLIDESVSMSVQVREEASVLAKFYYDQQLLCKY